MSAPRLIHDRARDLGLCAVIASDFVHVCNRPVDHDGEHSWPDSGWNLCECGHAVVEHRPGRSACCLCGCHGVLETPSQTSTHVDAQPAASLVESSAQKGTPDLAAPGSDNAAGVAGTTGPTA